MEGIQAIVIFTSFRSKQFSEKVLPDWGYNYRMSNILVASGRGQLKALDERVEAKRRIFAYYLEALGDVPGIEFMPEAPYGRATRWRTCLTIEPDKFGADRETVRLAL
jgi:dTDP-4-amino-4,6-dideoxygalactose transaminase